MSTPNTEKITKSQKYAMIEDILVGLEGDNIDMLIEFVQAEASALANKSAKAKAKAAEKKAELDPLAITVLNTVTTEPMTRDTITELINDVEVTIAKVGARLTKLVEQGLVVRTEVEATSASGKKTTRKAYTLTPIADADAE